MTEDVEADVTRRVRFCLFVRPARAAASLRAQILQTNCGKKSAVLTL